MRIIGGRYGGRRINPPAGLRARPTTDFAREGLFNVLNNRIDFESVTVLDLFSGTGSISFEFASRGAIEVHLIEQDPRHINGIKSIIKQMGFRNIKPVHIDVKAYLKICNYQYDIVFADPPYDIPWLKEIPGLVFQSGVMKKDGIFILEHPRRMGFTDHPSFYEHRSYGGVKFSFFRQQG